VKEILELISAHDGQWGWYQLDRALSLINHSIIREGNLMSLLKELEEQELITSEQIPKSPHPKYLLTNKGKEFLRIEMGTEQQLKQAAAIRAGSPAVKSGALRPFRRSRRRVPTGDTMSLRARSARFRAKSSPHAKPEASKPRVLIVDDSISVRWFLSSILEQAGYRVAQARDGQDAIEQLTSGLIVNAVICDIEMPRLDGFGFLAQVKASPTLKHLPITMLTSQSEDNHRQLALQLGASKYFSKPFKEQELLQALSQLIQSPHLTPTS
jgi:CheY-like chemotaxis protein/DNA-binding PadR family transcriptional regulator